MAIILADGVLQARSNFAIFAEVPPGSGGVFALNIVLTLKFELRACAFTERLSLRKAVTRERSEVIGSDRIRQAHQICLSCAV